MKYYIPWLLFAFVWSVMSVPALYASNCDSLTFDEYYAKAEAARKKAASVGGEWHMNAIPKPMASAKAKAKKGDWNKACELVQMVESWGHLGYEQAMSQKDAGPLFGNNSQESTVQCNESTYPQFVEQAKASQKLAASVGGEWYMNALPKPMKTADRAAKQGKWDRACQLVQMVEHWGQAGYLQAITQRNAGPRF